MTVAPARPTGAGRRTSTSSGTPPRRTGAGAWPWLMAAAITVAVCGAALSLNGVLRGWNWYWPAMTTVVGVAFTLAALRSFRAQPLLVTAGGFVALGGVLSMTFFRSSSFLWVVPTGATLPDLDRLLRRASETVLAETAPVAPNAGIVMVVCAVLGLAVILVDALAVPLGMPAASGTGLLALLVVPAMIKPQSVGVWSFVATAAGYLLILACSQWFAPEGRLQDGPAARSPGLVRRAALTGAVALAAALVLPLAIPGFDRGTFPQGSRLNPWGAATGLNPMITLGNSLRTPDGSGRITYASNSPSPLYLRSVTVDNFDGDSWGPDDRTGARVPLDGRIDPGYPVLTDEQVRLVTAVDAGSFTSPYLPVPYAPETVRGLGGQWTWDPATLSIKGTDTTTRRQEYLVTSAVPKLSAALLAQSSGPPRGISDVFTRIPGNVPDIVKTTAQTVAGAGTPYQKAMAIQKYLRSSDFTYSLQSPVQGGYDGNGLSVLADFLQQKSGYCIHYASAMAVMARLEGIPSRIAVGYAPGRLTGATITVAGQGALPEYEADARDAHAWPELYFQGLGWVPFEPTPSRGVVPDYATEASAPSLTESLGNNDGLIPDTAPAPTPSSSATAQAVPGAGGSSNGDGVELMPWLLGAAAASGLVLLAAAPHLVRSGTRARRLRPKRPDQAVPLAWSELGDLGTDYGMPAGDSETPRAYAARFRNVLLGEPGGMDQDAHEAVASLTAAFERRRYGRPGGRGSEGAGLCPGTAQGHPAAQDTPAVQDIAEGLAAVESSLRANATRRRRWAAAWLPPSVIRRLGLLLRMPFGAAGRALRQTARLRHRRVRSAADDGGGRAGGG